MSLRAFHIAFILICIVFLIGFGFSEARFFQQSKTSLDLFFSVASFILGVLLAAYLTWFVSKIKKASH